MAAQQSVFELNIAASTDMANLMAHAGELARLELHSGEQKPLRRTVEATYNHDDSVVSIVFTTLRISQSNAGRVDDFATIDVFVTASTGPYRGAATVMCYFRAGEATIRFLNPI